MSLVGTTSSERERQAYNMLARGMTIPSIAKVLHVKEETVKNYINKRRDDISTLVRKISQEDYAAMVIARFEGIREEVQSNYESAEKDIDRARFLKLLMEVNQNEQKALTELGLLDKAPEKVEHTLNANVLVSEVDKSQLEALTALVISQRLGQKPESLLAMAGKGKTSNIGDAFPSLPVYEEDGEISTVTPVLDSIDLD